jgi:hypothetical protein
VSEDDPRCAGCGQIALIGVVVDAQGMTWHRSCFGPPTTDEDVVRRPASVEELERTRDGLRARVNKAREAESQR